MAFFDSFLNTTVSSFYEMTSADVVHAVMLLNAFGREVSYFAYAFRSMVPFICFTYLHCGFMISLSPLIVSFFGIVSSR